MSTWYALVHLAATPTAEQLADATERLPGFATIHQDETLGQLQARFDFEATGIEQAARAACSAAAAAFGVEPSSVTVADEPPEAGLRRQLAGALVDTAAFAGLLGISRQALHKLAARPPVGFPSPIGKAGGTDVYLRPEAEAFAATRKREAGMPKADAAKAAERLYKAALTALKGAGFKPNTDTDTTLTYGTHRSVLVSLLPPHLGSPPARRAADALAHAGVELAPHAPRQAGRNLVDALADGELLALALVEAAQHRDA